MIIDVSRQYCLYKCSCHQFPSKLCGYPAAEQPSHAVQAPMMPAQWTSEV